MQFDLWHRRCGWLSLVAIVLTAGALAQTRSAAAKDDAANADGNQSATKTEIKSKAEAVRTAVDEAVQLAQKGQADLTSAPIIVSGGRGLKQKENFQVIFDLAQAVGGSVGASRPVVDAEWLPREYQIGSSPKRFHRSFTSR